MRKFQSFAFAGAIALAGVAGFSACSSDDAAEAPLNPTFDGESVKTAFAINVAAPSKGGTRMTDANTQNGTPVSFLGINNIRLIPLTTNAAVPSTSDSYGNVITLSNLSDAEIYTSSNTDKSSKIYSDVNIPVGTNNFLFYGTSPLQTTAANMFAKGDIKFTIEHEKTVGDVKFELSQIKNLGSVSNTLTLRQKEFIKYLNAILDAKTGDEAEDKAWNNISDLETDQYGIRLREAYSNFVKLKAGSGPHILEALDKLYAVVLPISKSSETENKYVTLAGKIKGAILNSSGTIQTTYSSNNKLEYASGMDSYSGFPENINLPQGSMVLAYDNASTKHFSYVSDNTTIGGTNNLKVSTICFPAPLTYYANTPLRAASTSATFTWPETTANWDNNDKWSGFTETAVTATTTKVALQNNINYGVAELVTTVTVGADPLLARVATSGTQDPTTGTQIPVKAEGFPVTGILIGGQPESVKFNFVSSTANDKNWTIYDKNIVTGMVAKYNDSDPKTNYTLVLDNYNGDTQEDVTVAIELVNNTGYEFLGADGLVGKNQKFYLLGKLQVSKASATKPNWPEYADNASDKLPKSYENRYPAAAGTAGQPINRVFVQDYKTTAKFTITSLKNAYVTIPDLRASKVELGLSVDLTWQTGLTFNVDL